MKKNIVLLTVFILSILAAFTQAYAEDAPDPDEEPMTPKTGYGVEIRNINSSLRHVPFFKSSSSEIGVAFEGFYTHEQGGISQYVGYMANEFDSKTSSREDLTLKTMYTGATFDLTLGTKVTMLFNAELGQTRVSNTATTNGSAIYENSKNFYYGYGLGFLRRFGKNHNFYVSCRYMYRNYGVIKGFANVQNSVMDSDSVDVSFGIAF